MMILICQTTYHKSKWQGWISIKHALYQGLTNLVKIESMNNKSIKFHDLNKMWRDKVPKYGSIKSIQNLSGEYSNLVYILVTFKA